MITWSEIRYFKEAEFDSPDEPGSGARMNETLVRLLDILRRVVRFPIVITSGFRSPEHNEKIGGAPDSAHLIGRAVDISIESSTERFLLLKAALGYGFTRIGLGTNYMHLDIADDKPSPVIWIGRGMGG